MDRVKLATYVEHQCERSWRVFPYRLRTTGNDWHLQQLGNVAACQTVNGVKQQIANVLAGVCAPLMDVTEDQI